MRLSRTPKYYNGNKPTSKQIKDLLPLILGQLAEKVDQKPLHVLSAWPALVGERIAKMTKAVSFESGVIKVHVKNSTLLSLLVEHEKQRLLMAFRRKFPALNIRNILFRIG